MAESPTFELDHILDWAIDTANNRIPESDRIVMTGKQLRLLADQLVPLLEKALPMARLIAKRTIAPLAPGTTARVCRQCDDWTIEQPDKTWKCQGCGRQTGVSSVTRATTFSKSPTLTDVLAHRGPVGESPGPAVAWVAPSEFVAPCEFNDLDSDDGFTMAVREEFAREREARDVDPPTVIQTPANPLERDWRHE